MDGRLESRVAVVTGGANGIGRACCERFAEEGADVVVADLLEGTETVAAVETAGRKAIVVRLDAASPDDNEAMARTALDAFGRIDVLVTSAGISHGGYRSGDLEGERSWLGDMIARFGEPGAGITNLELDAWNKVLDVNLTGTMLAIRAVAPAMLQAGRGSIITLASIAAKRPEAGTYAYSVSKAGVWMLTKAAARDLAPAGIRVNAIGPGFIETNMTAILKELEIARDMLMTQIPLGRVGSPRDVANCALFLASDEAGYVTGELLHPDGGFYTD
jgi:NAD(P)-dependent dehydrogenase (short-subunit alcohol dehydrogenase family)